MTSDTETTAAQPTQPAELAPAAPLATPATNDATPPVAAEPTADPGPAPAPASPTVSFDDFLRVELRVAKVLAAEPIPKSKKLLKVTVDTGAGERTIVAGVARAYAPETLVGRSVVIVANLETATLMGVESNGMLLAATGPEGHPVLLTLDDPAAAPAGSRVR